MEKVWVKPSWQLAVSVAGELDVEVAVSATLAAGVSGWGVSRDMHLLSASLLFGCGQEFLLSKLQLLAENVHCAICCGQLLSCILLICYLKI